MKPASKDFKIGAVALQVGMFVSKLDRTWVGSGFPFEGALMKSAKEVERLQRLCSFVYVDPRRGSAPDLRHVVFEGDSAVRRAREAEEYQGLRRKNWGQTSEFVAELEPAQTAHIKLASGIGEVMNDLQKGGKLEVKKLTAGVDTMIESITRNPAAFPWLMELRRSGEYSYQHALSCSVWAATFGRHLGLDMEDLRDLAMGGLLFDVGKVRLPPTLLSKPSAPSLEEFDLLHTHVAESVRIVADTPGIRPNVLKMVAHHHERHDGSGYPDGLRGTAIPIYARMIGIIDSYDAMTSIRPYAASRSPHEAVMELYQCRDQLFQAELVEQFIATSGIYPTGSLVELTDGTVGVVMSVINPKRLRPCVMLLLDQNKMPLADFRSIDLSEEHVDGQDRPLTIRAGLPRGAFGINASYLFLD